MIPSIATLTSTMNEVQEANEMLDISSLVLLPMNSILTTFVDLYDNSTCQKVVPSQKFKIERHYNKAKV